MNLTFKETKLCLDLLVIFVYTSLHLIVLLTLSYMLVHKSQLELPAHPALHPEVAQGSHSLSACPVHQAFRSACSSCIVL